jgi:hypothetical protein
MKSQTHNPIANLAVFLIFAFIASLAFAFSSTSSAAQTPTQSNAAVLGQVIGEDVSVRGPSETSSTGGAHVLDFVGGSTIVVHSGQARVEFAGGGELDVCGPAKFTVLASGEALTIAVSFGRFHAQLDPSRPVTFYTPLIKATPLAVMRAPRDVTLGLEPTTGAMCVLAAHGALEVQQQLSDETLIVPEPSEVSLSAIPLIATTAAAGSCRCDFNEGSTNSAAAPTATVIEKVPVQTTTAAQSGPPAQMRATAPATVVMPSVPLAVSRKIDQPDLPPPALPSPKPRAVIPPPVLPPSGAVLRIVAPPLFYEAKPLMAPAGTISVATVMLAKAAVVEPEWIFHGVVSEPVKASKKTSQERAKQTPGKSRRGFWAWFHKFLFGSPPKST